MVHRVTKSQTRLKRLSTHSYNEHQLCTKPHFRSWDPTENKPKAPTSGGISTPETMPHVRIWGSQTICKSKESPRLCPKACIEPQAHKIAFLFRGLKAHRWTPWGLRTPGEEPLSKETANTRPSLVGSAPSGVCSNTTTIRWIPSMDHNHIRPESSDLDLPASQGPFLTGKFLKIKE